MRYDVQMQTNVLSHFLLTKELFGLLRASDDARIVNHTDPENIRICWDGCEAAVGAFDI